MSPLRQSLKRPEIYLAVLAMAVLLAVADSGRNPAKQVTGRLYVAGVHCYQAVGRPLLNGHIRCRYQPTCSEYSIEAVRKYGICKGFWLTAKRINSCTTQVPMGTRDPVPPAPERAFGKGQ